jgi:hypothetical protein
MKRNVMLLALFVAAFSFPSIGSVSNADALGNYGCGNPDKRTHVNCLRALLSTTPFGLTVMKANPSKDGLGNYGCGNSDKTTHTTCLRSILDQHGAHLQTGGAGPMNPPATFDDGLMGAPAMGAPGTMGHNPAAGMPGTGAPYMGAPGAAGMRGGPAAQDMGGNMINDGGFGANSGRDTEEKVAECINKREAKMRLEQEENAWAWYRAHDRKQCIKLNR